VVKALGNFLLVLALLGATGGHWAVLQTVAWADMLATNLQNDSFGTALNKTFDGKNPCKLCKGISAGKEAQKETEIPLQLKKLEFISACPVFVIVAPNDFRLLSELISPLDGLSRSPSIPPPRSLVV
jgi:hypothetical protein